MDEKEIKARLKSARESIQNKNFNEAVKLCEQILRSNPSNYTALVFAGRCHVELDNPTSARECYEKAAAVDESQLLAWQGLLQYYEKYCIWDDKCVTCLRKLLSSTSDEKKKRDYHFQLATTLAKGGRVNESATEFSILESADGDTGWKLQVEEAVIRFLGNAVVSDEKAVSLVKECYDHGIERATGEDKASMEIRLSHFLMQNQRFADAYGLFTRLGISKEHGTTFLCDFTSLLCERCMQDSWTETDEKLLAALVECFEDEDVAPATGNGTSRTSALIASALADTTDQNWSDVIEALKPEKLRISKNPFLWYLLAEAKYHQHDYFGSIVAAEEAQRGWQGQHYGMHRLKSAITEASSHLEIGTSASLKKASSIYKDALAKLQDPHLKNEKLHTTVQLNLARTLAAGGSLEEALEVLSGVQEQSTPDYLLTKALIFLKFADYAKCKTVISEAESAFNDAEDELKAKFHYVRGRILWDADKDKSSAFKEFSQAAKLDPCHADSFFYIGLYYDQLNDEKFKEKAMKCYERAYSLDGRYKWQYGSTLSDAYRKCGYHEKNLALLLEITESQPVKSCSWAWLRLGLEYLSEGQADDAVRVLQIVLRQEESDVRCWECLGEAYAIRGSYASAVKAFERVGELESEKPQVAYAKYRMAMISLVMQRYEAAAEGFMDVLKLDDTNLSSVIGLVHALVELAKFYFSEARYQRSLDVCAEATRTLAPTVMSKPRCPSGWYLLGSALTMVNNFYESDLAKMAFPDFGVLFNDQDFKNTKVGLLKLGSRCLAQSIQLNAKVAQVWHDLGMNLFFQASNDEGEKAAVEDLISQALNCLKHAIQLDPIKAKYWSSLANVAASALIDQPEMAQHCFIKSLSLEPHQAAAWTGLGVLYKKYDEIQLAHKCFERAQSIDPDYTNCWIGQAVIAEEVQPKEALDLFRHAVELGNSAQGYLGYAYQVLLTMLDPDIDHSTLEYQDAIEHLQAVPVAQVAMQKYCFLNPTDPCALNMLALLLEQERMYSTAGSAYMSALDTLKKLAGSDDENAEEFVTGNACRLFGKLGNSAAMRKLAGKMTTQHTFENLCMRGLAYYRLDQLDKASEMYSQAVYASGTKTDQALVNCAFALIAAKQGDWKKTAEVERDKSLNGCAPWIIWSSVSSLWETGSLDMARIMNGFMRLAKAPWAPEWQAVLAAACCLYCEALTLPAVQWLMHLLPYDCNVRFAFKRIWKRSEVERRGIETNTEIHALAKWQAVAQLKESHKKDKLFAKIKHTYPDMFSL